MFLEPRVFLYPLNTPVHRAASLMMRFFFNFKTALPMRSSCFIKPCSSLELMVFMNSALF